MKRIKHYQEFFPFIVYFLVLLLYSKYMNYTTGDYGLFSNALKYQNIFSWLVERYYFWSSRLGIEFVLAIFTAVDINVFRIVNIVINVYIMYAICKLVDLKSFMSRMLLLSLFLMYNIHDMSSAGWIPTEINYRWVVAAILTLAILLKIKYIKGKESYYALIASVSLVIFSGSHEQGVIILIFAFATFLIVYYKRYKLIDKGALSLLIASFLLMLVIVLAPGNALRMQMSISANDPLLVQNNMFDKIWLGVIRFHSMFLHSPDYIKTHPEKYAVCCHHLTYAFVLIMIVHCLTCYKEKIRILDVVLSVIPALILLGYLLAPLSDTVGLIFAYPGMPFVIDYENWSFYAPLLFSILFCCAVVCYLYRHFDPTLYLLILSVLLAGLASQVMMGFSPTIYISSHRTSVFLYFSILLISSILFKDIEYRTIQKKRIRGIIWGVVSLLLIVSVIDSYYSFLLLAPRGW